MYGLAEDINPLYTKAQVTPPIKMCHMEFIYKKYK